MAQSDADLRELALKDLYFFARLINPHRVYGECHKRLFRWWMQQEKEDVGCTLVLWPRDHQKSHCAAVYAAWCITRDPAITILYVSATSGLAEKQLKAIKDMLTSDWHRRYWPDLIDPEEGKRERWTQTEIAVDHPLRKKEGVRDSTVFAAGLTTNVTGFHASHVFLDDIVVPANAYTEEGREKVRALYSQLASIETTGARETAVGTRYHPADIYADMMAMQEPIFDENDEIIGEMPVYKTSIEVVETDGKFLWPREKRLDGKQFGFNMKELARKKAKYVDNTAYWAQYYQQTNAPESHRLDYTHFLRYNPQNLKVLNWRWSFKGQPLNIYAAIDFAFSLNKRADYTAIVVIGVDPKGSVFVLDIDRFRTDNIETYYQHIIALHSKWTFKKLRAEVTSAQKIIVDDLRKRAAAEGLRLVIEDFRPNKSMGSKEERVAAVLEPRYMQGSVFHNVGPNFSALEEELVLARPAHDDIKDALAAAVEIAETPRAIDLDEEHDNVVIHGRFGGVVGVV